MADDEIVMETLLILIGGDETTRHTLSGGTEQLLRHRDQWDRLVADPDALLPGAIEEMLRWTSPVKNMCRTLTADTDVPRHRVAGRREDHADVRVGQLRRVGVRRSGELPYRSQPEQPRGVRLRRALLSRQSAGSPGAFDDDAPDPAAVARPAAGRRGRDSAAAGELRQWTRGHAGGVHPGKPVLG